MAITFDRLPRKTKISVDNNGKVTRTHTEKFRIYSDVQIDQFTAGQALGLTGFSTPAYDPLALLKDFDCEDEAKTRDPWRYIATAVYSTGNAPQQDDNPLNAPVEITVSTSTVLDLPFVDVQWCDAVTFFPVVEARQFVSFEAALAIVFDA